MDVHDLMASLTSRIRAFEAGDSTSILAPQARTDIEDLSRQLLENPDTPIDQFDIVHTLALTSWYRYQALPEGQRESDLTVALAMFLTVAQERPDLVPSQAAAMLKQASSNSDLPFEVDPTVTQIRVVLDNSPRDAPFRGELLSTLGHALENRFGRTGDLADLDGAIGSLEQAVDATMHGHADHAVYLSNLGNMLRSRFEHSGDLADLDNAVVVGWQAANTIDNDNPNRANFLSNLGVSLLARFKRTGELADLKQAMDVGQQAVDATTHQHADRVMCLINLASAMWSRFERTGDLDDLDNAVNTTRQAVNATSRDHRHRVQCLSNLGLAMWSRFRRTGDLADLNQVVHVFRLAGKSVAHGYLDRAADLSTLGEALQFRFERTGDLADLDEAVEVGQQAVDTTAHGHPNRAICLSNLGSALRARFARTGDLADINQAVHALRQAAKITGHRHPDRTVCLQRLGNALTNRFERTGDLADLSQAIDCLRQVVDVTARDHPDLARGASSLANALVFRFERTGDLADLNQAVDYFRQAVGTTARGHPDRTVFLSSLVNALWSRFERTGDLADLDEAVEVGQQAVDTTAHGHPNRAICLSNLGIALRSRFERTGDLADLNQAVNTYRRAVSSVADDHPFRAACLSNLGIALRSRFERTSDLIDLDEAVDISQQAVSSTPINHHRRPLYLSNLGTMLVLRSVHTGDLVDLDQGVDICQAANNTADDHPFRAACLSNLGIALRTRFERTGDLADLDQAVDVGQQAVRILSASPTMRIKAAQIAAETVIVRGVARAAAVKRRKRATHLVSKAFSEALPLYQQAVELVPRLVQHGLERSDSQHLLEANAASLGRDAAACAIAVGDPGAAVELLEQARGVVWGQLLEERADLTGLRNAYSHLATELENCRTILDHPGDEGRHISDPALDDRDRSARNEAGRRFEQLVSQIRALAPTPQFPRPDRFLKLPLLVDLLPPPDTGPIIVINTSRWGTDALILTSEGVDSIDLPVDIDEIQERADQYLAVQHRLHTARSKIERAAAQVALDKATSGTLAWLWNTITDPIMERIKAMATATAAGNQMRVWWCPTGPLTLLPLHAAGDHSARNGRTVIDRVISSYTPTLRALTHARTRTPAPRSKNMLVIAIANTPPPDGADPKAYSLPGAAHELQLVTGLFNHPSPTILTSTDATRHAITDALAHHRWVHIACHGTQDLAAPAKTGLMPYDWNSAGLVGVNDLTSFHHIGGEFAFLSACQTATGGVSNTDEVVNLTAAMQHAGWRHVIGTLWTINDNIAPQVAQQVYKLLAAEGALDSSKSAHALHAAVKKLRDNYRSNPSKWSRFIHTGPLPASAVVLAL